MKAGTIVKLKEGLLDNPVGAKGVCYDRYVLGNNDFVGCSFIFENGKYDGFSEEEQKRFLVEIGFDEKISDYVFTHVMRLSTDYKNGYFDHVLKERT